MTPDRKQALESARAARQAKLEALRARQAEAKSKRPSPPSEVRVLRAAVAVLTVALMGLLVRDCSRPEPVPLECEPCEAAEPTGPASPAPPPPAPAPAPSGRMERLDRPDFAPPAPSKLPWLDAFHMQVSARSPRLAQCFVGTERPGRLKWTTSVSPADGVVSDHELQPLLMSDSLTTAERDCVLEALEHPTYRLSAEGQATPSRVGIVIEF